MASDQRANRKSTRSVTAGVKNTFKKTKNSIDSILGEDREFTIPKELKIESFDMADGAEVIREMGREMGRVITDTLNRQAELNHEREDVNIDRFTQMLERQENSHKRDISVLGEHFDQMRISKERDRGTQVQTLVKYDGGNIDIDEWQDKCLEVIMGNHWDQRKFIENIPASLSGRAKRAFVSLKEEDKATRDDFFQAMRGKIDPLAKVRNKDLFISAHRANNEGVMTYIDRLRLYIRRSGGNPKVR